MEKDYTYYIDFLGTNTSLIPRIDWSWWKDAQVVLNPQERLTKYGSLSVDQIGLDPIRVNLSSNVLIDIHFEMWMPNKGIELVEVSDKIQFISTVKNTGLVALGIKRPQNEDAQEGSYLVELTPGSKFTLIREDKLAAEIRRYHLRWETLFNRCRLIETVDAPESLSSVA